MAGRLTREVADRDLAEFIKVRRNLTAVWDFLIGGVAPSGRRLGDRSDRERGEFAEWHCVNLPSFMRVGASPTSASRRPRTLLGATRIS